MRGDRRQRTPGAFGHAAIQNRFSRHRFGMGFPFGVKADPMISGDAEVNRPGIAGGRFVCVLRGERQGLKPCIVRGHGLSWRDVADWREQAAVVEPVDPFEGGEFDGLEGPPWAAAMDHRGFVEAVDRLGESVVVAVADAADRRFDTGLGQALGVLDGHALRPTVGTVDKSPR